MRRKPNLDARLDRCAHLLTLDPESYRGRWLSKHPFKKLHIELGCGKGLFTVETAKSSPDVLLVALEKTANVMVIALELAQKQEMKNVRFINALADNLDKFFAPGEVSRIYLNFSDPWPAKRHIKRRMTAPAFLALYRQILCPDGQIHFKTDNLPLFEYSVCAFEQAGFTVLEQTIDLHKDGPIGVMTDYEIKFHAQGVPINKCIVSV
ncbi:MAG: tRNA (guanosine(46)-N7)-methyltransferase TrmB [Oscillospiraceae bacterium]|nr:tRNA (guanosine(46)-N7)-methyltransferase TrmB [Oscillospiraceae bacterium]